MHSDGQSFAPPLYLRIKQELVEAVDRGEYEAGRPFITQREVCERYGVSSTTAVRALNELVTEGVLVRRRGRGTFVSETYGAEPPARGAADAAPGGGGASAASRTLSVVLPSLTGPHPTELLHGAEAAATAYGYRIQLAHTHGSNEAEAKALHAAAEDGAAGVLLYPHESATDLAALGELRRRGIPLVMCDRYRADLPTDAVLFDNFGIGHDLTEHLIARGHRRIGTIWDETVATSIQDRMAGHKQALTRHGLPVLPELTVIKPYLKLPEAARLAHLRALLEAAGEGAALLCVNGYTLAQAASDLVAIGADLESVDLAGMDDAGPYDLLPLAAVSARLPSTEMGSTAVELIHRRITGGDADAPAPRHVVLPVGIRARESSTAHLRVVRTEAPRATPA